MILQSHGILINVDDNEVARYARHHVLARAGFTVFDAGTGGAALELAEKHNADMVLLDVHLPDINGVEVCRILKNSAATSTLLVLQISATAIAAPQAALSLENGADAYLTEPTDPDVLLATVRALLRLKKAERQLHTLNQEMALVNNDLARSNHDLQQFAMAASHDLQEPLRTIQLYTELVERSASDRLEAKERQHLALIVAAAERMRTLVGNLLTYSKAGRNSEPEEIVDLTAVASLVVQSLAGIIADKGAKVDLQPLPKTSGDSSAFTHVFQNLLTNALKYSDAARAPVVRVSSESTIKDELLIRVADNGMGIEPQYQEMIFLPFKRLHGPEISGTGIGLALCRRIIEAYGGRLWVESQLGEGSVFSFTLPNRT